jgi:hypothetical protein
MSLLRHADSLLEWFQSISIIREAALLHNSAVILITLNHKLYSAPCLRIHNSRSLKRARASHMGMLKNWISQDDSTSAPLINYIIASRTCFQRAFAIAHGKRTFNVSRFWFSLPFQRICAASPLSQWAVQTKILLKLRSHKGLLAKNERIWLLR